MRRMLIPSVVLGCLVALLLACYGQALVRGRQFAFRDAGHYYYPLYQRVQAEWEAGRWPLWEPEENAGMPLLGNPTAAVLYPGKVLYAVLPYAWGARLYIVAHTALAFAGMLVLMRSWGASPTGAALAALGYAFGMPILFQSSNIIFLVGAAWLPLGLRAADRWLRLGRRWGLLELAVVLAMQTLGGDPESAYVLGVCAVCYALALARSRGRAGSVSVSVSSRGQRWRLMLTLGGLLVVWTGATLLLAAWLPTVRPETGLRGSVRALPGMAWVPLGVVCVWALVGLFLLARWRRRGWRSRLGTMLSGLIGAAALAAGLTAAQLLPVLEFTGQSLRAAGPGTQDIMPFSLEPIRLVEFVWPNCFGTQFQGNRSWRSAIPQLRLHAIVWVPSLYLGGLTILLALGTLGFRGGPPWRGWLSAIAIVSLLASLGEYTGPLYWARWFPWCVAHLGPHDPFATAAIRLDGFLRDGDGSLYWLLATALPGFRQFRFPSKLLTFTTLALAGLAGLGWDRLMSGRGRGRGQGQERRLVRLAAGLLALSLTALTVVIVEHDRIIGTLRRYQGAGTRSAFGPFDPAGAYADLRVALVQAAVVLAVGLVLACRGGRAAGLAGVAALLVTTADLALANARHVLTVPQEVMETTPRVVRLIAEAERRDPSPGPYRIFRMPLWHPFPWRLEPSPDRDQEMVAWERNTLQPKYGLAYQVQYTRTFGVTELYDYAWFFGGFLREIDPQAARAIGATPGQPVVVYPRRAFDLWNTRYFILPVHADWPDEHRGYAAFLPDTERIYPDPRAFEGADGAERQRHWIETEDFQILRNRSVYPRAWVVHQARVLRPITGEEPSDGDAPMRELLFSNEPLWRDPGRSVYDPHALAWIDSDRRDELKDYLPGTRPGDAETVTVTFRGPQCVALEAVLDQPGLVVLADVFYPGWRLTIDGVEAPIYRVNRMMRGAAVQAGRHRLVYAYQPGSFALGGRITLVSLAVLAAFGVAFTLRPVAPRLVPDMGQDLPTFDFGASLQSDRERLAREANRKPEPPGPGLAIIAPLH